MCVKFAITENSNCLPFREYKIITNEGEKALIWGNKNTKVIHKRKEDLTQFEKGLIAITGFYVFKNEKAFAPIGFGDHKERLDLQQYLVTDSNMSEVEIAVLHNGDKFYILVEKASEKIKNYQPNEPYRIINTENWLTDFDENKNITLFSQQNIKITKI